MLDRNKDLAQNRRKILVQSHVCSRHAIRFAGVAQGFVSPFGEHICSPLWVFLLRVFLLIDFPECN